MNETLAKIETCLDLLNQNTEVLNELKKYFELVTTNSASNI